MKESMEGVDSIEKLLERKWVWNLNREVLGSKDDIDQHEIRSQCDKFVSTVSEHESMCLKETSVIVFLSRFNLPVKSHAPWATADARRISHDLLKNIDSEALLVNEIEASLMELRTLKLSTDLDRSGRRNTHKMKILGKLVGKQLSDSHNKMNSFRIKNATELGLLYTLIEFYNIEKNWRLILPYLLNFFDDSDFMIRREACLCLIKLCERLSAEKKETNILILSQTGPLLKDAILPLILSLPSLTPVHESIALVDTAYDALIGLLKAGFKDELQFDLQINSILNDTLLPSMAKVHDYPEVLNILLEKLTSFFQLSGNYSIVIAKQIIYTLITSLMDPYISHANATLKKMLALLKIALSASGGKDRYKYDVLGCMGVLKKRVEDHEVLSTIEDIGEYLA